MKRLQDVFPDLKMDAATAERPVSGLASDSRKVQPGFVFFAVPGSHADGGAYAGDACAKGAVAVVCSAAPKGLPSGVACLVVPDVRAVLAKAAAAYYSAQPQTIVAITGTSGKTSIAEFARQIWASAGLNAASLGTLGVISAKGAHYGSLTTPDAIGLHQTLAQLTEEGVTHLAMEASSHGLDQMRLDGVKLAAGAFSNLSRDHLDYHATPEAYLAAKLRLVRQLLQPGQPLVIDADASVAGEVALAAQARGLALFSIGKAGSDIRVISATPEGFKTRIKLEYKGAEHQVLLPLAGMFQVANALVAAGLCIATGMDATRAFAALGQLKGAPGRLEYVGTRERGQIFVDYAHKPDALAKVLQALRPFVRKSLIVVFGCGGDRDAGKRPIMGEIASQYADVVIVTDDNPRSEEPAAIRREILAKAPHAVEIADREAAIRAGIKMLSEDDLLLIAGKGHESGQIVGSQILPFSDHEVVLRVLKEMQK